MVSVCQIFANVQKQRRQMYFFGAFVIPVFILVIAVVLETMVEQESVSKTVVGRVGTVR